MDVRAVLSVPPVCFACSRRSRQRVCVHTRLRCFFCGVDEPGLCGLALWAVHSEYHLPKGSEEERAEAKDGGGGGAGL